MKRSRALSLIVLPVPALLGVEACRSPTQITVAVEADAETCKSLSGLAITVGRDPQLAEEKIKGGFYTTVTMPPCDPSTGRIGTLVVTPNEQGARGALVVVAAVAGTKVDSCRPENGYANCVVARRTYTFVDGTPLSLPIKLDFACVNVPCNAESTCKGADREVACVTSSVACSGESCGDFGIADDGGVAVVPEAPTSNDASVGTVSGSGSGSGTGTGSGSDAGTTSSGSGSGSGSASGSDAGTTSSGSGSGSGSGTASGTMTASGAMMAPGAPVRWHLRGAGRGSGYG